MMEQPGVLSLQLTSLPAQLVMCSERIVLMRVPAPQVSMVAVPETLGDHWKTSSGPDPPHPLETTLAPEVTPVKVPPAAGMGVGPSQLGPGSVFLVRRTPLDWVHTGIIVAASPESFQTIEGNTNDTGSREGYEVCARVRGYAGKDFVLI